MEDRTKETMKITTEGPKFEMPSHYMKEVVASVKTKRQSHPVKTKKMTKPKNKPVPKMVRKWVPKIATPMSVRNMVPTLTSSKRRGLSLNGRC
jgi:hypothetical protein